MLRRVVRFGAPLPLLYLGNKATSRTPKVAKAKSEKAPFEYAKYKVTPKHLQEEVAELECRMNNQLTCPNGIYNQAAAEGFSEWTQCHHSVETSNSLSVWTRKRDTGEKEYRLWSRVDHLSWKDFLQVQLNVEFRKEWDGYVKELAQLECDESSRADESCIFRWVQKMPGGLMYPREYIYLRDVFHDAESKTVTIIQRDIPGYPEENSKLVRVKKYRSSIVIKYDAEDGNGFWYLITYHDDVNKVFPGWFSKWADGPGARWSHNKILEKCEVARRNREAREG